MPRSLPRRLTKTFATAACGALAVVTLLALLAGEAISSAQAAPIAIAPRSKPASAPVAEPAPALDEASDELFRTRAEAEVLRKVGAQAKRDGLRLMLFVAQGRPVMLDSRRPDPNDGQSLYVDYRLDGLSPDREFFVVRVTLAFGDEVLWISRRDGTRYEMHGNAHPSPDGRFLVVTHASAGVEFNGVVVWAIEDGKLVERYKFQATPDQRVVSFRFMRWRDRNTVELEQFAEVDPSTCANGTLASLAQLTRKDERWILRSASGPRCDR